MAISRPTALALAPVLPEAAAERSGVDHASDVNRIIDGLESHLTPGERIILACLPDLGSFPALPSTLRAVLGWHTRTPRQSHQLSGSRRWKLTFD